MMKNFLFAMMLLAMMPVAILAERYAVTPESSDVQTNSFRVPMLYKAEIPSVLKGAFDKPQSPTYKSFKGSTGNPLRSSWMLQEETEPIAYDPKSNSFVMVGRSITATEDNQPFWLNTGQVWVSGSYDNGNTWTAPTIIYEKQGEFPVMPSISVTNPSGSANIDEMNYFVFSRLAKAQDGQTSAPFYGALLLFAPAGEEAVGVAAIGPADNNPNQRQKWFKSTAAVYNNGGIDYAIHAGQLLPETGFQGGNYGVVNANLTDIDYSSLIPNQWGVTKFRVSDNPASGSHYNNNIYVDADEDGTVYAVVCNMFVDFPDDRRVGVSFSTDNGATWSEFEKMPANMMEQYAIANGANKDSAWFNAYQQDALTVYGVGKFSYFARVVVNMPHPAGDENHIVEVKYDNGNWSLNTIQKMPYGSMWAINLQAPAANSTDDEYIPFLFDNGFEIQSLKTVDGHVVVKWLQHRDDVQVFAQTQLALRQRTETDDYNHTVYLWDSLESNDVMIAYRKINESAWNTPLNVTDDQRYNKNTFMPRMAKDIHNIPILHLRTDEVALKANSTTTGLPINPQYVDMPSFLCEMVSEINDNYYIEYIVVDATQVSVEDAVVANNSLEIFPNPISDNAAIKFNVEGNVVIRISNALGQSVAEIANGNFSGNNIVNFDASSLTNGTYYVTMTVDGNSTTKVMNVVK